MQLKPEWASLRDSTTGFFKSLGPVWSIALIIIVLIIGWFIWGWASDGINKWKTDREIEQLKEVAAQAEEKAKAKEIEAAEAVGAAAAFKQQAEALQTERTELLNARPELQRRAIETGKRVEAIRNQPLRPVTDNMRQRVDELGARLDKLYVDP